MANKYVITSEYVSNGHPDKVADQISDCLLDTYIEQDPNTRAGIETMVKDNIVVIGGEVKSKANIDVEGVIREVVDSIRYPISHNLRGDNVKVINLIGKQSYEISRGVDKENGCEIGAGDQGFMVGFASDETPTLLPLGVYVARQICQGIVKVNGFGPDAKTQVAVEYGDRKPKIKSIVVSIMYDSNISIEEVRDRIKNSIFSNIVNNDKIMDGDVFFEYIKDNDIKLYINPNGPWYVGGPISDCGVTGRKIVVDQYGGYCNVGGGSFSGKDMTKVDRSGAYMCRYIAKNIVHAGLAKTAKVELSYIIGKAEPCNLNITLTNPVKSDKIKDLAHQIELYIMKNINLTPKGIICRFFKDGVVKPIFFNATYTGHFGFNNMLEWYPWENTDFSDDLKEYIKNVEVELS